MYPVTFRKNVTEGIITHTIRTGRETMQGSDYIHADMLSETLNTWSEIKLQFLARPGSDTGFSFFLSFSYLLHCVARQAIIFELNFLP